MFPGKCILPEQLYSLGVHALDTPSIGIGSLCILPHEAPSWKSKFPSGAIIKGIHHEKSSVDEDASRCPIQSQGVVATFLTVTKCLASNTKDGAGGWLYNYSMCATRMRAELSFPEIGVGACYKSVVPGLSHCWAEHLHGSRQQGRAAPPMVASKHTEKE